jgi:hypothetical protein
LKVLDDQKAEESRRCKQMEFMFSEEAEGFWSRQDRIWREEKTARKMLMDDVVDGWKEQVKEKIKGMRFKMKIQYVIGYKARGKSNKRYAV